VDTDDVRGLNLRGHYGDCGVDCSDGGENLDNNNNNNLQQGQKNAGYCSGCCGEVADRLAKSRRWVWGEFYYRQIVIPKAKVLR
jgi:hypothetical protein